MCLMNNRYPCGKCIECISRKRNDWSIRLQKHLETMDSNHSCYFATLTYDEDNVPWIWVNRIGNDYVYCRSLCKLDVQRFMKRFRINIVRKYGNQEKVKFFLCGEYGPTTQRPHYHIIVFNFPNVGDCAFELQKAWIYGEVRRVSPLVNDQCHYATKYMLCESFKPHRFCTEPFKLMSKGLGSVINEIDRDFIRRFYGGFDPYEISSLALSIDWKKFNGVFDTASIRDRSPEFDWETFDFVCNACCDKIVINGHCFNIPRYNRNKIYPPEVRMCLNVKKQIENQKRFEDYNSKFGDYDRDNDISMRQQMNQQKFERLRSYYDKRYKKNKTNKHLHK